MAFRTLNHDDTTLFNNRLWKLMEKKNISTAKELATALYEAGLVAVKQKPNDNSDEVNKANAIGSVEKKIQAHLNADKANRLQGEYVAAYCEFFGCSADYLFGQTEIVSGNDDVRHFCEITGLSEKAVKRLIDDLPDEAKAELTQWWSEVLESNLFYGLPMEWHGMCYELGQYYTAQNEISRIHKAAELMDSSDKYVATLETMMTENYLNEAKPHETAYFYHLSSITANMTEFLEQSAEAYAVRNKQRIDAYFSRRLHEKLETGRVRKHLLK
jgi:hypothetical protein